MGQHTPPEGWSVRVRAALPDANRDRVVGALLRFQGSATFPDGQVEAFAFSAAPTWSEAASEVADALVAATEATVREVRVRPWSDFVAEVRGEIEAARATVRGATS